MVRKTINLDDGTVTIKGKWKGQGITVTGNVGTLEVEQDEYDFTTVLDKITITRDEPLWLKLTHNDGHLYKVTLDGFKITKRATVDLGPPRSGKEIEAARKRSGAPKKAAFSLDANKGTITFVWVETVYE